MRSQCEKMISTRIGNCNKIYIHWARWARPEFGQRKSKFELEDLDFILGQITYDV